MDAIAGLSLAANILQLVELSGKLLSKGREIQQAGSTIQNSELETVAADVVALSTKLRSWTRPAPIQSGPLAQQDQVCPCSHVHGSSKIANPRLARLWRL